MVRLTNMVGQMNTSAIVFDWLNGDVRTLRERYERVRAKPVPDEATWLHVGTDPDVVKVLRFPAEGEANTAIVYFHGGGFIVGSPLTHADIAMELAKHSNLLLCSVDYRLAPDHPAPAPAEDGISVIRHLIDNGFNQILLCGDSAGGAIALSVEATLPDDLHKHIIGVASFYGAHGLLDTKSLTEKGSREDGTDRACVARYFLAAGRDAYSVEALAGPSPVPVYLVAADDDPLRDDTLILAKAMRGHGRDVTLDLVANENHGFLHHHPHYARAEAALGRFATWVETLTGK